MDTLDTLLAIPQVQLLSSLAGQPAAGRARCFQAALRLEQCKDISLCHSSLKKSTHSVVMAVHTQHVLWWLLLSLFFYGFLPRSKQHFPFLLKKRRKIWMSKQAGWLQDTLQPPCFTRPLCSIVHLHRGQE